MRKPLETAPSGTAVTDGNFSPNKRSDFRVVLIPSMFYGLNTASWCGFSSIFFPWEESEIKNYSASDIYQRYFFYRQRGDVLEFQEYKNTKNPENISNFKKYTMNMKESASKNRENASNSEFSEVKHCWQRALLIRVFAYFLPRVAVDAFSFVATSGNRKHQTIGKRCSFLFAQKRLSEFVFVRM